MQQQKMLSSLRLIFGSLCAVFLLSLCACDQPVNSGGTVDSSQSGTNTRSTFGTVNTNDLDRVREKIRTAATNVATDVGRGLERTGQEIQNATRNSTNR